MAILFPASLDALNNPTPTEPLGSADPTLVHSTQHGNANDAIEALEAKVGVDGSAVATSIDYLLKNAASANPGHTHTQASLSGVLPLTGGTISSTLTVSGNLTTNLTANSIPFIGASGLLSQDNTNLTWDNTNKWIKLNTLNGLRQTYFGAYPAYKVLQVGVSDSLQAIAIGFDPHTNSSGDISGTEIIFPNNKTLMFSNAASNGYIGVLGVDSSNIIHIGSTTRSVLTGSAIIINTSGYAGVGRTAAAGASTRLHVGPQGATTLAEGIQLGDDVNLYRSAANTLATNAKIFQTLPAATNVGITIKEAAAHTANPFVLTDSSDVNLSVIRSDGAFYHTATIAYATASEQHFGVGLYPQANIAADGTFYALGLIGQMKTVISTSKTNSGYSIGLNFSASRYLAADDGTLADQEGIRVDIGHNTGLGANARTTACFGLRIRPYAQVGTIDDMRCISIDTVATGGTLTAQWALYSGTAALPSYHNGVIGVGSNVITRGRVCLGANTTAIPHLSFVASSAVNVSSPVAGDVWYNGTNLYVYDGSVNKDLLHTAVTSVGAGTNYALTNTMAELNFGTTDPAVTLTAGTYLIQVELTVDGNSGGTITAQIRNYTDAAYVGALRSQNIVAAGAKTHLSFSEVVTITASKGFSIYAREPTGAANDVISTETFIRGIRLY